MSKKVAYIAGPMAGIPDFNFPAFHEMAKRLREAGWEAKNPADNFGGRTDLSREIYIRADVAVLAACDAIVMLPGWQNSRGAKLEYFLAQEMGLEILDRNTLQPIPRTFHASIALQPAMSTDLAAVDGTVKPREGVLAEAQRLTGGDRQDDYGHPRDDFAKTALMWTGILRDKLREGESVGPGDVPLCMIAVKLARQTNKHKRDNLVDIAGYARTAAMVAGDE